MGFTWNFYNNYYLIANIEGLKSHEKTRHYRIVHFYTKLYLPDDNQSFLIIHQIIAKLKVWLVKKANAN